jgi:hypothetical protein
MNYRRPENKPSINLHIEELVLHGFPSRDRYRIARAIEGELTRLLSEGKIPSALEQSGAITEIDGGAFEMKRGATPEYISEQISQKIYGGLNE